MKTYPIIISRTYPKHHSKAGQETEFVQKIAFWRKLHTLRNNYYFWQKRFEEIQKGTGTLSLRYWSGKPYKSKQLAVASFSQVDGIGIERLDFKDGSYYIGDTEISLKELASNDGLTLEDFLEWFDGYPDTPMAIIHFTGFRYSK